MKIPSAAGCALCLVLLSGALRAAERTPANVRLEEGYALLYDLAENEKQADGIFIMKYAPDGTKEITRQIAALFRRLNAETAAWMKSDGYDRRATHLPEIEIEARKAINSQRTRELFGVKGEPFNRLFLRLQEQSTTYGINLLDAVQDRETNADRRKALAAYEKQLRRLKAQLDAEL